MATAAGCTPDELLDIVPCLQCLTSSELKAVLVLALATLNNYDLSTDLNTLMEDSACNVCMTDKQMLEAITAKISIYAGLRGYTINELRDDIKCLICTDPRRINALLVYLTCKYFVSLD